MTTTVPPTAAGRVAVLVGQTITVLQRDYLGDQSHAVGALARLRRGAGKEFAQVPDLWGLADTRSLHETPAGGRPLREEELVRAEDAVHAALTLWALHQQSRRTGMHRPDSRKTPTGLGAAVRRLMPAGDIDEPIRKRLVRAGTAPHLAVLAGRLRDIVLLLRREDIALDYGLLAEQLYRWQEPGGRDEVRRAWGRQFNAYRTTQDPAAAPDGSPAALDEDTAALADKDAS